MSTFRIALANLRVPAGPDDSVGLATAAVADAARRGAMVTCFPECFVPGYRWPGTTAPPPDPLFLERAEELVATGAEVIATACPFCRTMFRDALGTVTQSPPELLDIAQIAAARLPAAML